MPEEAQPRAQGDEGVQAHGLGCLHLRYLIHDPLVRKPDEDLGGPSGHCEVICFNWIVLRMPGVRVMAIIFLCHFTDTPGYVHGVH